MNALDLKEIPPVLEYEPKRKSQLRSFIQRWLGFLIAAALLITAEILIDWYQARFGNYVRF